MRVLLAVILAVLGFANVATAQKDAGPVRVYVFAQADTSGFVDADQKQVFDSVADMKKHFKKLIVVDDQAQADITVEVMKRNEVASGNSTAYRSA